MDRPLTLLRKSLINLLLPAFVQQRSLVNGMLIDFPETPESRGEPGRGEGETPRLIKAWPLEALRLLT